MALERCVVCQAALDDDDVVGVCARCLVSGLSSEFKALPDNGLPGEGLLKPIRSLGDYQILDTIGEGGMGVVYRARQAGANREVALKVIRRSLVNSVRSEARFLAEAEAAATLDHPHIVPIIAVGTADEIPFYTMKLVRGRSLADIVVSGEIAPSDGNRLNTLGRKATDGLRARVEMVTKVAEAIHYAHDHGVLHRDLKPSNVLVDENGDPNIIDFGIAKRLGGDATITQTGELIGTPAYMAPEQTGGRASDQSIGVDVYGLGGILHFALTGHPPFAGENPLEVLQRVKFEESQPLHTYDSRIDLDLSTITLKCLEKKPEARYASADEVAKELRRWLRGESIRARPMAWWERAIKWSRRRPYVAASSAAALLLISFLSIQLWQTYIRALSSETETQISNQRLGRTLELSRNRNVDQHLARGDVGKAVAYLTANLRERGLQSGSLSFLLHLIETQHAPRILGPPLRHSDTVSEAAFHPDGLRVATSCHDGAARIWWIRSGELAVPPLRHRDPVYAVNFSPDGTRIVTSSFDGTARVWDVSNGQAISPPLKHLKVPLVVDFTPDGDRMITAGFEGVVRIWRGDGRGAPLMELRHDRKHHAVHVVKLIPGREQAITGTIDGAVFLWDLQRGEMLHELETGASYLSDVMIHPSAENLVILAQKGPQLWDLNPCRALRTLPHFGMVWSAVYSADGSVVSTISKERLQFWDSPTGRSLEVIPGLVDSTSRGKYLPKADGLAFFNHNTVLITRANHYEPLFSAITEASTIANIFPDPYRNRIATHTRAESLTLWEWPTSDPPEPVYRSPAGATDDLVVFGQDDSGKPTLILGAWEEEELRMIEFSGEEQKVTELPSRNGNFALLSWPSHQLLGVLKQNGKLQIIDTTTRQQHDVRPVEFINLVTLSPDGRWLVGNADEGNLWRFSLEEDRLMSEELEVEGGATIARFSPDGKFFGVGRGLGGVKIWETRDWKERVTLQGRWGRTTSLAISDEARVIATGSNDGILRVYRLADSLDELWRASLGSAVKDLLMTPNETHLIAGTFGGEITVWDLRTGVESVGPMPHNAEILRLAIDPAGQSLLAVYADQKLRFWDPETSQPLTRLLPWYGGLDKFGNRFGMGPNVNLSGDGKFYSVGLIDERVEVRSVPTPNRSKVLPEWLPSFAEAWAGSRVIDYDRIEVIPWRERMATFSQIKALPAATPMLKWAHRIMSAHDAN